MKNKIIIFIMSLLALSSTSCLKKTIEIEVVESACEDFKLKNITSKRITDPSCTGSPLTAEYEISFSYDGDSKCLDQINLKPKFYDASNTLLSSVATNQFLKLSDTSFVTNNVGIKSVTFRFLFVFPNATEAKRFDHCNLTFSTQNQQGNPSKDAQILLYGECATQSSGNYTVKQTINVNSSIVTFTLWDDGAEDGDIINLYQGNTPLLLNHMLTNAGNTFTFTVPKGTTDFILTAVNQGSVGPNTCALKVNGMTQTNLSLDLSSGQAIRIVY
ncbi:MAG: hypothetical protein RLZZ175_88 [Bacteroidota bacterium]|jgi:hypothetical protein